MLIKKGPPEGGTCSFRSVMTKIEGNAPIKNSKGNISGNLQFSQRNNHLIINILFLNKLTLKGRLGTDFINGFLPPNLRNRLVKHVLLFLLSNDNYRLYSPNNAEVPQSANCLLFPTVSKQKYAVRYSVIHPVSKRFVLPVIIRH